MDIKLCRCCPTKEKRNNNEGDICPPDVHLCIKCRVGEWLLFNAKWAILQLYHSKNKLHIDEMMSVLLLDQVTYSWIFIVLVHWNNSLQADMLLHSLWHIILSLSQWVFALTPYCYMLNGEATKTNFIVFYLTKHGLEPTIYQTRAKHANHFIINAGYIKNRTMLFQTRSYFIGYKLKINILLVRSELYLHLHS